MEDVIIIGAGPCGLFAGFYAGMHNLKGRVIESLPYYGGQLTTVYPEKMIYDIPGVLKITAKDYIASLYQQYIQFSKQVPIDFNTSFSKIEKKDDYIEITTNNGIYQTKSLLITAGNGDFTPRKINVDNSDDFKNIVYTIRDKETYKNKKIVILGGGDSALDWGLLLQEITDNVTIIHRRNEFRAHESSINEFKNAGGIVLTPYNVTAINGDNGIANILTLENIEDHKTMAVECDLILVCYGFLPSRISYNSFGIESTPMGITVGTGMSTTLPGVFAAGNCINYPGKIKTITSGNGDVVIAIQAINNYLHPTKNPPLFSSFLMEKK